MSDIVYWGEQGQYGSFSIQEDGWPNAGEIQRYFRELRELAPEEFAKRYSEGLKRLGRPNKKGRLGAEGKITATWVLNMERQNRVPTDILRRRLIADILRIPPILFGLASLEDIQVKTDSQVEVQSTATPTLQRVHTDIGVYQNNIRVALQLHRTGSAQSLLPVLDRDIHNLSSLEQQAKGDLRYKTRELLLSNSVLAANIVVDKKNYALAHSYTDNAVETSRATRDDELIARALSARGYIRLVWGLFGTMKQGMFQVNREMLQNAVEDFRGTLTYKGLHPQLEGNTKLHLSRALSHLKAGSRDARITEALLLIDEVENLVGSDPIDDLYTRALVTGTPSGLHMGSYLTGRAATLNALGLHGKALQELQQVKRLSKETYGRDETRKYVWCDIVTAEVLIGMERYGEAIGVATDALLVCQDLNLVGNISLLTDIYSRLARMNGTLPAINELGDMLKSWYSTSSRG